MKKIRVLDEHIANQIAAGEVVERPSSIVKELVENAIDAGSEKINIAVEEGGLKSIRVTDDGSGIEAEECHIAFERHATSKITIGKDLFQIRSLGFRGEALPSIAAVSKLECITSARTDGLGRRVIIEGGAVVLSEETAASRGTDIVINDLFYNTPARLKYMKTIQTELTHISNYVYRLCLAHPHISFTFSHNKNVLLQTLGNGDVLQAIAAIYGTSIAKHMVEVGGENLDYKLFGYIGKPEATRANRFGISIIVNGRYIQNFALAKSVMNAYHTLLPINRFPIAVLDIQMEPTLLDVNVHPSKLEVRFSKEQELLQFIEEVLRYGLQRQVIIPQGKQHVEKKHAIVQEQLNWSPPQSDLTLHKDEIHMPASRHRPKQRDLTPWNDSIQKPSQVNEAVAQFLTKEESEPTKRSFPQLYPIGQMHGTYIIAQNEEGLYLIDQHAAHERIHFEYYYEQFGKPHKLSQDLLVPITLEFTPSEVAILMDRLAIFEQAGVIIEFFGGNSFIVRSHPQWFPAGDEKSIIEDMAEWVLREGKMIQIAKLREEAAIMCSCKAAIKANHHLSNAEIEALLKQLQQCQNPYTCPHGRPIIVSYSNYELEKMFKRV